MPNSYRIRTQVGVDKYVNIQLDQDFEFLEILSLKILQSQIYTRPCSDYGVVVGRISVNNGFGIPNAKVSVFVPLTTQDETDPIISSLYPYKTLSNINDDGYRYNLLPYVQSYSNHTPTGTFPTRKDILTNPYLIEVFDKYYKYTCTTNDSGDFMIFGVPVGSQTIHVDVDLSDIGEFSLSPQDLIRMGVATQAQVAGTKFKSSTNLAELPQLIQFNRVVQVEPLWGEPEICNLGITRTDFDLTSEVSINITPTAIFMGSLISSNEDQAQKANCKPRLKQGGLCNLVVGPGQILAIRQTIQQDPYGRPGLEVHELDEGGQLIDDNGTWMFDVPMNMDRVVTNEFGQQVISNDPKAGIPTTAKYRFKIKWNQAPSLKEPIKRGYFLVPNIKEYGWTNSNGPDPINSLGSGSINQDFLKSYAFSVNWDDYGNTGTTVGQQMIQEAIDAEDRFYFMEYNKVYTVSQLLSQYRNGYASNRIISLKNDLDDVCESENNKFPTNDANFRFDIIYLLALFLSYVLRPTLAVLLLVVHILAFFLMIIGPILAIVVGVVFLFVIGVCKLIELIIKGINKLGANVKCGVCPCPTIQDLKNAVKTILNLYKRFTTLSVPELTYPDCDLCSCNEDGTIKDDASTNPLTSGGTQSIAESGINSVLSQYTIQTNYNYQQPNTDIKDIIEGFFGGQAVSSTTPTARSRAPQGAFLGDPNDGTYLFTPSLTLAERINLFNTKAKYFDDNSVNNPGGGVNRIKVKFNYPLNGTKQHFDNVVVLSLDQSQLANFPSGKILSFVDPSKSKDVNMTGVTTLNSFGTTSITGTPVGTIVGTGPNAYVQTNVQVNYANPSAPYNLLSVPGGYVITGKTEDSEYQRFPIDVEYFQVITAMTYSVFDSQTNPSASNSSLNKRFLGNTMRGYWVADNKNCGLTTLQPYCCLNWSSADSIWMTNTPYIQNYTDYDKQVIVFLVRGVDPHSTRNENEYDLSYLFGYSSWGQKVVTGNFKLNVPIQTRNTGNNISAVSHLTNGFNHTASDSYANIPLYYPSFQFQPSTGNNIGDFSGFTSNLPRFYSNLENNSVSSNVVIQPGGLTRGLVVSNNNFATKEYMSITQYGSGICSSKFRPILIQSNSTTGTNNIDNKPLNKGYYQNEIVDGGSVMYYENTPFNFNIVNTTNTLFDWRGYEFSYVYPSTYNLFYTNLGTSGRQIVMRSDRLPSSDFETSYGGRSYLLQNNLNTAMYLLDDQGNVATIGGQTNIPTNSPSGENSSPTGQLSAIFDSFTCGGMVPLECYDTNSNGQIIIKPNSDACYTNKAPNKQKIMKNGCYIFVTQIFLSLPRDLSLLFEWLNRFMIIFGACRNVWSHLFTNNWINGTLYAFAINNDRFYTSPTANPPNKPFSEFCRETIILHPTTNNFYYRSSPYNPSTNDFIGRKTAQGTYAPVSQAFGSYGGNIKFLGFPTTMMDMGPKTFYIQELVMSDKYDGYVVNKMNGTTYQDVSEILNLFIMTRLANTSFLGSLLGFGGASILSYFSRPKSMVDGDYAQMISINSELSTNAFQAENYTSSTSVFLNGGKASDGIFGIFFSADNQTRDYVTPKRTIINPNLPLTNSCGFNKFGTFSQIVPFYEWEIKKNQSTNPPPPNPDSIFGSQKNDWYTDVINNGITSTGFHKYRYQSLDRLNISSRYFMTNNINSSNYFKSLIYSVDSNGVESPNLNTWSNPAGTTNVVLIGAPFQFYFGLKKGKTSFDRFVRTYLNFENIIDE